MNLFIDIFLPFFPNKNHLITLWSCEKNCRKSKQLIQRLDWLPSLVSTLLPFKKMCLLGERALGTHCGVDLLGAPYHSGASLHIPRGYVSCLRGCLLEWRWFLCCCWWELEIYHLCILGPFFCPLQAPPKNIFRKNKHLKLPKTLKNWPKDSNIFFPEKKR